MRSLFTWIVTAVYCAAIIDAKVSLKDIARKTRNSGTIVPNRYILEFESTSALSSVQGKRELPHADFYARLQARGVTFQVTQEYTSELFLGAAVTLSSDNNLQDLIVLAGLKDIFPVSLLRLPDEGETRAALAWPARSKSPASDNKPSGSSTGPAVATTTKCTGHGKKQKCSTSTITVTPSASPSMQAYPTTGFSILPQIGADKVHAKGIFGKGIKVAIIDSGVDYTQEPLGGCFGPGCKIVGGYDYVGDDFDGNNEPVPDNDPYDNCYSHGTTTAGIIGANDNFYNITGVAPQASILVYRVYSCSGATFDSLILSAMERAFNEGADIINLSLGETTSWNESPLSVLASRLVDAGVVVTAAAGNSGQNGGLYTDSPGTGVGVISTGSTDSTVYPAHNATVSSGYGPIRYFNFRAFATGSYPLFAYTTDPSVTNDGCVVPEGTPDLAGKLVVVRRGGCSLSDKARNAYNAGATAIFVVDVPDAGPPVYQNFPLIDFATISNEDGNYLISQVAASSNVTVAFKFNPAPAINTATGGLTSYFSSIGPTNNVDIKPQVLAPGSNIIGVVPASFNNYRITDGTSWSSAYAAGSAALLLSAEGGSRLSPTEVQAAFQVNARNLPTSFSDSTLFTVAQQGAGQLQISDAIQSTTSISPSQFQLNDTANAMAIQFLKITNNGDGRKRADYKLSHSPAGTASLFRPDVRQPQIGPLPQSTTFADVRFSDSSFSLKAGQSKTVLLYFSPPKGVSGDEFPVYSGFIDVATGGVVQHVPYLGIAAKLKNMPIIDNTDYYLGFVSPVIQNAAGDAQTGQATYTLSGDDTPTVIYRQVGGSALLLIDLITPNASLGFTPDYSSRKRNMMQATDGSVQEDASINIAARKNQATSAGKQRFRGLRWLWWYRNNKRNTFNKVPIIGNVYETDYSPRNTENVDGAGGDFNSFNFAGSFTNGTVVPDGTYKFLLRALKITGNPALEADYEAWTSQTFTIRRA